MAIRFRIRGLETAVLVVVLAPTTAAASQITRLDVLLQDGVGVPGQISLEARAQTLRVFRQAGVLVTWLDPASDGWRKLRFYTVRLRTAAGAPTIRSLGFAAPGTRIATVVYSRVEQTARDGGGRTGVLLGHAIAHELGHLLLGDTQHSAAGLMRADLDVRLAEQGRLLFTEEQAQTIRARLGR